MHAFIYINLPLMLNAQLQEKFPEWKEGSFAQFAVMQIMRYKRRGEYPAIAQALLELHQSSDSEAVESILNEMGSMQQNVGMEFIIFLKSVDKSLVPHIEAGYGVPILAWAGLFVTVASALALLAHYLFGVEIKADTWNYGLITVETFWVYFGVGLLCCGFFYKKFTQKKPGKK